MRVAERRQHSAEVCGDILHYERKSHVFALARSGKHKIAERQKSEQCHIVCNQHRTDKCYINKCENAHFCIFKYSDNFIGKDIKEIDVFQCTNNRKNAKQTSESFKIKISYILPINGYNNARYNCRNKRYAHYKIFADKVPNTIKCQKCFISVFHMTSLLFRILC